MIVSFRVATPRLYEPSKPERDAKYRVWVRSLPCAVCGTRRGIEAAHTGSHGLGQKASDKSCIPLCCRDHKTGPQSLHNLGPVEFERVHALSIGELRERLNMVWGSIQRRKAA